MNKKLHIWCDGSCSGNPGPGGYASAIVRSKNLIEYRSGYSDYTTNNRMELMGFIGAINFAIENRRLGFNGEIVIHTDSKYVENPINCGWLVKWMDKKFEGIKNPDLWIEVYRLIARNKYIKVEWVKGHNGKFENELVDGLAVEAMKMRRTSDGIIEI